LGRLNLEVLNSEIVNYSGSLIPIDEDIEEDLTVKMVLNPYFQELGPIMNEVVGTSIVELDALMVHLNSEETNLGNLVADSMLWAAGDADMAFHNAAGFRWKKIFPAGDVTRADVHELLPYGNSLILMDLTGEQVKDELEICVSVSWMQVSGVKFTFDPSKPENQRIVEVWVDGEPIDEDEIYRVAVCEYIAAGGSGHSVFAQGQNYVDTGVILADCLINYLLEFSPIDISIEGRIVPIS
jgi:2',3'-cyclic-nucleotide 2'-phosphodiesterase (5'-nucleotidase family)